MENLFFKFIGRVLLIISIVFLIFLSLIINAGNQARRARFTVDVLEQYLQAYRLVEGQAVERLSELPDFHLISTYDSLSLKSADLKQGIKDGYIYDFQSLPDDKFVISASPVGWLPFRGEFGITEKGALRMNNKNVDAQADSYEEVDTWAVLTRIERVRTNSSSKLQ